MWRVMRAKTGPLGRGERSTEKSEGWPAGCGPVRRRHRDVPSANPGDAREPGAHGCAEGASAGWPFFGPPFFGHAKKGGSRAREAREKGQGCRCFARTQKWIPAFAGMTSNASSVRGFPSPSAARHLPPQAGEGNANLRATRHRTAPARTAPRAGTGSTCR